MRLALLAAALLTTACTVGELDEALISGRIVADLGEKLDGGAATDAAFAFVDKVLESSQQNLAALKEERQAAGVPEEEPVGWEEIVGLLGGAVATAFGAKVWVNAERNKKYLNGNKTA